MSACDVLQKFSGLRHNFGDGNIVKTKRRFKMARIFAGLERASLPVDCFGLRMNRAVFFRRGRTKDSQGGQTTDGSDMAWAGIVANKLRRAVTQLDQLGDIPGGQDIWFIMTEPPLTLSRVARDLHRKILLSQLVYKESKIFERPYPSRLRGTRVNENRFCLAASWEDELRLLG